MLTKWACSSLLGMSCFLKTGVTKAFFQFSGTDPWLRDARYINVNIGVKSFTNCFRNLEGSLSGPAALFGCRLDSSHDTPSWVTLMGGESGYELQFMVGIWLVSSFVNTDVK